MTVNSARHVLHVCRPKPKCTFLMCTESTCFCEKNLVHSSHGKGFSLVWTLVWFCRVVRVWDENGHSSQWNRFGCVWVLRWKARVPLLEKVLGHRSHV